VKEHYLRDDIYCGSSLAAPEHRGTASGAAGRRSRCSIGRMSDACRLRARAYVCSGPDLEACKLSATPEAYLVIDSNVALHQARAPTRRSGAPEHARAS
jgi:hypothetical protein